MPTVMPHPDAMNRPRLAVISWASLKTTPAPNVTVELSGAQRTCLRREVRIMTPSGQEWRLRKSCPGPATAMHRLCLVANATAAATCAVDSGHTTNAGCQPLYGALRTDCRQNGVTSPATKHVPLDVAMSLVYTAC